MFTVTLFNVLMMLLYIVPGFLIRKAHIVSEDHLDTASGLLVYSTSPCLILSSFLKMEFSWKETGNMALFFLTTLLVQALFLLLMALITKKKFDDGRYRVMNIASVMGNVGFFGLPIVAILFPDAPQAACYATMYMVSMNVILYSYGAFCITHEKRFISLKAIFTNPAILGLYMALPAYFLRLNRVLPDFVQNGIANMGNIAAPLCMLVLGVRLASTPAKDIFGNPYVFFAALLKLVAFPLFAYACVVFLPLPKVFKACVLILSATPCASAIQSLSELYKCETRMAAGVLLLSTLACFITIPLLALLL